MSQIFTRSVIGVTAAALLFAAGIMQAQFLLAWMCFVPLFFILQQYNWKRAFFIGLLFGLAFGLTLQYWMVGLVASFSGYINSGIALYSIATIISMLYFGFVCAAAVRLNSRHVPLSLRAAAFAGIFTLGELILTRLFPGMPWFGLFRASNMVLDNLYTIQYASIGGSFLISFAIFLVNFLISYYLHQRSWKKISLPVALVIMLQILGYGIFRLSDAQTKGRAIKVALVEDATAPEVKWNAESGPALMQKLINLHQNAVATHPDIILWSESVVPWTYRDDDDFALLLQQTAREHALSQVVGMTTDISDEEIYNSAYSFYTNQTSRSDKQYPVSMAEQPWCSIALPLQNNSNPRYEVGGDGTEPLLTHKGKAAVLICNDATVPGAMNAMVRNGATFGLSLSNDAWFSHIPFLVKQHYLNTRLRAVETRRDVAINCNRGISGVVHATGAEDVHETFNKADIKSILIFNNKIITLYIRTNFLFPIAILLCIVASAILTYQKNRRL
jgi:apolipoprotein N-acyltransferase